ncbi:uncharacterized protein LOC142541956 [Primulina tabacum]|uniref:uncharacterized protein LOC142541956 n=1 Tax=Primulina tabacum TaxID=48773 RepID=UPI003F59A346
MNSNVASQFMDKQIMDLSNSQTTAATMNSGGGNNEFIDFMNRSDEKRDGIVPSYDFMPILPGVGSSSSLPSTNHVSKFDSGVEDPSLRTWNSLDSKINVSSNTNHNSLDIDEPAKFELGQSQTPLNASLSASLVSEIDKTVKKYTDNLMHTLDGVSARLSQLETRTRKLENSMDDLKESVGNNLGVIDGKLRQMGNILREVQTGVQVISEKQERVGELPAAKLQSLNLEQVESQNLAHTELTQSVASANQQFSTVSLTQPPPSFPPPNAPPPPPPQQNSESHVQFPNQYSQNQTTSVTQQESYFPPSGQTPQQQYQVPPPPLQHQHQHQLQLQPPPPQHQNQPPPPQHQHQPPPPRPQYSQPPPPQHQHHPPPPQPHSQPLPPPQLHPPFAAINTSLPQTQLSHHSEETLYGPTQTYPPGIRLPSHPSVGVPPPQQLYSLTQNAYEPQSSRPIPGYSHPFGQSAGQVEPYSYSSSQSQYGGSDSPRKPQQPPNAGGLGGGSGYPQLPTSRILPQAIPTASNVGGSGSGGSGNKVPIDDVVEKVTHMGFPRDQVRATVRKLTEKGQPVDLNVVLDKLMNDSEGQAPRGWFGR